MRELETQLQQAVIQLQEGLETSATGRLSSVLILPHNLSKILQEVTLRLPQDVSLIAGSNTEDMYLLLSCYGTSIRYHDGYSSRSTHSIERRRSSHDSFQKPTLILGRHIQIEPEASFLAVTENRQFYSLLTTADLLECQKGLFTICEPTFPFIHKTRATCASALLFWAARFGTYFVETLFLSKTLTQYGFRRKDFAHFGFTVCRHQSLSLRNVN
jgi:hypothetical protein